MSDLKILPNAKLRKLIGETEETLTELKLEMERRDEAAQAREIDRLEDHMKDAELSLQTIRDFFRYLVDDIRTKG